MSPFLARKTLEKEEMRVEEEEYEYAKSTVRVIVEVVLKAAIKVVRKVFKDNDTIKWLDFFCC